MFQQIRLCQFWKEKTFLGQEFLMEKIKVNIIFYKADNTKHQNKQILNIN
jgi:hypothetical protein